MKYPTQSKPSQFYVVTSKNYIPNFGGGKSVKETHNTENPRIILDEKQVAKKFIICFWCQSFNGLISLTTCRTGGKMEV